MTIARMPDENAIAWAANGEPNCAVDPPWRTRARCVGKSRGHVAKGLALVVLLHSHCACGGEVAEKKEAEFRAVGIVSISRGNDKSNDKAFNFEAFVKGNRWLIRTEPFDFITNKSNAGIECYQAGTNGTNVYSAALCNAAFDLRHNQEVAMVGLKGIERELATSGKDSRVLLTIRREMESLERQLTATQPMPEPRNQAFGEMNVGVIPRFLENDLIAPIWLALCSQGVIGVTNLAPGLFHFRNGDEPRNLELFVSAEVSKSLRFPHLPEFVGFSNSAVWLPKQTGSGTVVKALNAFGTPFQEATYAATFKSFGGLALPSAFEVKRYSSSAHDTPKLRYLIVGRVTDVSPTVELPDFLPHLPVVAAIADYRLIDDNLRSSVRVFTKPGEWPSVETVRGTKEYSRLLNQAAKETSRSHLRRTTILLSIASISSALAVLAWKAKIQN